MSLAQLQEVPTKNLILLVALGALLLLTTGFLNGFFSIVKNRHVRETKCIALGDPYCEWEFR